jgi:HK97 family phage prohead protease
MHLVERGDVSGCSFGFRARAESWDHKADPPLRTITDAELLEISIVTFPAYPEAGVALRSLATTRTQALRERIEASIRTRETPRERT